MPTQPGWNQQWGPQQVQPGQQVPPQQTWGPGARSPKKRKKWPFILIPLAVLLLVWAVVRGSYELSRSDTEVAEPPRAGVEMAEPTSTPPPPPGAPVQCQPDLVLLCFPDDYNPDATMDAVAAQGWTCYRKGDTNGVGSPVSEARRCELEEQVRGKYGAYIAFGYERDLTNPDNGRLESFSLSVNTVAALQRGERTSPEDATTRLFELFDFMAERIWQGKPDKLTEAKAAFAQLKPQCNSPAGRTIRGATATTPTGYQLTCSSPGSWQVGDQSESHQQTLTIKPAT